MTSEFVFRGKVRGKHRPRFRVFAGHVQTHVMPEDRAYERSVADEYRVQCGGKRHEGALKVSIRVWRSLPRSAKKSVEEEPDTHRPDVDNVAKIVLDALNGVAWDDDSQVVALEVRKFPRTRTNERMVVRIEEVSK